MTAAAQAYEALRTHGLGPYLATPDGILAPLLDLLAATEDYRVISREENAVAIAAGVALAGGVATVLLQNSGLGLSLNALASLVRPYELPLLLVISQRGIAPDATPENLPMGALTPLLLAGLGIESAMLDAESTSAQVARAAHATQIERRPYALLVPPTLFGWQP